MFDTDRLCKLTRLRSCRRFFRRMPRDEAIQLVLKNVPKICRGRDGEGMWILEKFEAANGFPFDPFNRVHLHTVEMALRRAVITAMREEFFQKERSIDA